MQPDPAAAIWLPSEARIDLVVVPGLAFDRRGHRIGWGGGYYDRFLAHVQTIKIGLCYDELVLDCIPSEPHDVPMDRVVARNRHLPRRNCMIYELRIYRFHKGADNKKKFLAGFTKAASLYAQVRGDVCRRVGKSRPRR